jgi:DeoR/GlpR family transcriptional regulator of sugar metabolism
MDQGAASMRYERSLAVTGRLEKLTDLIRTGAYSTPALAVKLDVSEQTVYRDIMFLKQRGYSIRSIRQSAGWAYKVLSEPPTDVQGKGSSST